MSQDETRKYIHDLANSFSIIDASVARTIALLTRDHPDLVEELQRLRKADEYIKKSVLTLRQLREHVRQQMSEKKA